MCKKLKFLYIFLMLSLSALPLAGCANPPWEGGMTLVLKVDTPKDGTTVNTPTVTVSGRVNGSESASAKVSINDTDTPVKDGKFSTNVTLNEGKNVIIIASTAGQAKLNEQVTVTYNQAK